MIDVAALRSAVGVRLRSLSGVAFPLAFGVLVYIVAIPLFFPWDRVKDQIAAVGAARNLDVEVGHAGPTWGAGVSLGDIRIGTRPDNGKKPIVARIEHVRVVTSLLASLTGKEAYDVSARLWDGQVDVQYQAEPKAVAVQLAGRELSLAALPGFKETLNLPLAGILKADVDLLLPGARLGIANGTIDWSCAGCAVGDGKSKLKIEGNPLLAEGISVPRVRLGTFEGHIDFEKGVGKLQGVHAQSPDAEIFIEGEVRLADPASAIYADLYLRFKVADALIQKDDKIKLLLQIAELSGKRPDGFYGVRLQGSPEYFRPPIWEKTSPFSATVPSARKRPKRGPTEPSGAASE